MLNLLDWECTTPQDPNNKQTVGCTEGQAAMAEVQNRQAKAGQSYSHKPLKIRNRNKAWTLVLGQDEDKDGLKYKTGGVNAAQMRQIRDGETNDEWNRLLLAGLVIHTVGQDASLPV